MPAEFEGSFAVSTTMGTSSLTRSEVDDPKGEGRARTIEFSQRSHTVFRGWSSWSAEGRRRGSVDVSTSMGSALLKL
jgi:hypothetical protein